MPTLYYLPVFIIVEVVVDVLGFGHLRRHGPAGALAVADFHGCAGRGAGLAEALSVDLIEGVSNGVSIGTVQ